MRLIITIFLTFFLIPSSLYAEEKAKDINTDEFVDLIVKAERQEMMKDLKSWTDEEMVKSFYEKGFTEEYIKKLYQEFKESIVTPPNPDTYTEYSIPHAEKSLTEIEKLGKKMHNLLLAMHDVGHEKYKLLVWKMRDVLYIDWKHIPYAMEHNPGRAYYWYEFHNVSLKEVKIECQEFFNKN